MSRARKCMKCGKTAKDYAMLGINVVWTTAPAPSKKANGGVGFVCHMCAGMHDYSSEPVVTSKYDGKPRIALEVEYMRYYDAPTIDGMRMDNDRTIRAYAARIFGGDTHEDCTVDGEVKTPAYRSLSGMRDRLGQFAQAVDMSHSDAGMHTNISIDKLSFASWRPTDWELFSLFAPLAEYMRDNREYTEYVFGRYFSDYCMYSTDCFYHGTWLNTRTNQGFCLEWRLMHYRDIEQAMRGLSFIVDVTKLLVKYIDAEISATVYAKKVVSMFKKYATGYGACEKRAKLGENRKRGQVKA